MFSALSIIALRLLLLDNSSLFSNSRRVRVPSFSLSSREFPVRFKSSKAGIRSNREPTSTSWLWLASNTRKVRIVPIFVGKVCNWFLSTRRVSSDTSLPMSFGSDLRLFLDKFNDFRLNSSVTSIPSIVSIWHRLKSMNSNPRKAAKEGIDWNWFPYPLHTWIAGKIMVSCGQSCSCRCDKSSSYCPARSHSSIRSMRLSLFTFFSFFPPACLRSRCTGIAMFRDLKWVRCDWIEFGDRLNL